ncbi:MULTISPECIES: hypothetical protein [Acinetobacter]|uniref:Uncharacterized protein n=1 Tax=Acinetobacter indicus TaxID=756892 RepID=A0A6C0Y7R3_9GAMM|nr:MULTISPECIES: hypothetical protein [Acinetobacter]QIC72149.1 hypothetical protein FSC09_17470 [Acinetobacter indicus]QKQ71570.1 hypothetical protein E5Y90_15160 [Acinetobacter sp. 10FS3-1]
MAIDTKAAVKTAADKTKGTAKGTAGAGGGVKKGGNSGGVPKAVYIVGAILVLLVIGVIIMAFSGKKTEQQQEQATQQTYTDATATASASQGVDVYQTSERDIVTQTAEVDYSKELIYFTDPSTGMKMVETPNGPLLVGSAEGAAYIQDYDAKRAEWLAQNQAATEGQANGQGQLTAAQQQQELVNQQLAIQQARIDALEQEKVNLQSTLEQLEAYADKQTQTITNLTNRVTQMQPVFEHAAQQSKPKVQVALTGKNRSVEVDAVSGDMAWVSHEGKSIPVRVGDLLPGSNVRVKAIDSLHNKVILAK